MNTWKVDPAVHGAVPRSADRGRRRSRTLFRPLPVQRTTSLSFRCFATSSRSITLCMFRESTSKLFSHQGNITHGPFGVWFVSYRPRRAFIEAFWRRWSRAWVVGGCANNFSFGHNRVHIIIVSLCFSLQTLRCQRSWWNSWAAIKLSCSRSRLLCPQTRTTKTSRSSRKTSRFVSVGPSGQGHLSSWWGQSGIGGGSEHPRVSFNRLCPLGPLHHHISNTIKKNKNKCGGCFHWCLSCLFTLPGSYWFDKRPLGLTAYWEHFNHQWHRNYSYEAQLESWGQVSGCLE